MNEEYLCNLHDFFPQTPKLMNCLTNNIFDTRRNQGMCIHLIDIEHSNKKKLHEIKEKIEKNIREKKYEKYKNAREKEEVIKTIDKLLQRKKK